MRSDATPCDPQLTREVVHTVLEKAIRRQCVSATFEQGFPKYAWGWIGDQLYEARHINGPARTYKGYPIDRSEYPRDSERRLDWGGDPIR